MKIRWMKMVVILESLVAMACLALVSLPDWEIPKLRVFAIGVGCLLSGIVIVRRLPHRRKSTSVGDCLWGFCIALWGFTGVAFLGSFVDPRLLLVAICWAGISVSVKLAQITYEIA